MEDRITLDRKAFKVLASDTRIRILKSLGKRRKMLSELAKELGMSNSSVKEHLDNLADAGLVVQIDDGHKWKYYELTRKGRNILNPGEMKIWLMLSLSGIAAVLTAYDLMRRFTFVYSGSGMRDAVGKAAEIAGSAGAHAGPQVSYVPYVHIILIAVFSVLFGLSVAYLIVLRKNMRNCI